ncbi:hypothetical protein E4T47_08104 [Aureobasidium subglaciale]|nr:hypothetical protein E4T43_07720 [Aureobasidium subglaciale]KAI5267136.1 hypothetical protein E4T47_08104 [Aureobasidium subglaciale]
MPSIRNLLERLLSFLSCSRFGDDEDNEAPPRLLDVGGPEDFHHEATQGGGPLHAPIVGAPAPYVREH